MPLSSASTLQSATGFTLATTNPSISLPGPAKAGNTVIIYMASPTTTYNPAASSLDGISVDLNNANLMVFRIPQSADGNQTFTNIGLGASADVCWYVEELSGIDFLTGVDQKAQNASSTNSQTVPTGTTAATATSDLA